MLPQRRRANGNYPNLLILVNLIIAWVTNMSYGNQSVTSLRATYYEEATLSYSSASDRSMCRQNRKWASTVQGWSTYIKLIHPCASVVSLLCFKAHWALTFARLASFVYSVLVAFFLVCRQTIIHFQVIGLRIPEMSVIGGYLASFSTSMSTSYAEIPYWREVVGANTPDVGHNANYLMKLYLALQIIPSHIGLPLLVITFLFSKGAKRHPTLINVCISWIMSGIFSVMLWVFNVRLE